MSAMRGRRGRRRVHDNFVGDGNGYVGNEEPEPEVARTVSVTADWQTPAPRRWSIRADPVHTPT